MGISIRKKNEFDEKVLAQFSQSTEAELVKSFLESKGIICRVQEPVANWLWPGCLDENAIKLFVDENMYKEALKYLKEGGYEKYFSE